MKPSARYAKIVEWSDEDNCHVDNAPGLMLGGCYGDASVFLMENYSGEGFLNIGTGQDITIRGLAELVKSAFGFEGEIVFDPSKPHGTPRKSMDVSRLVGWGPKIELGDGIIETY